MPNALDLSLTPSDPAAAAANGDKLNRALAAGLVVQLDRDSRPDATFFVTPLSIPPGVVPRLFSIAGSTLRLPKESTAVDLLTVGGDERAALKWNAAVSRCGFIRGIKLVGPAGAHCRGLVINAGIALRVERVEAYDLGVGVRLCGAGKLEAITLDQCFCYRCETGFGLWGAIDANDYASAAWRLENCVTDGGAIGVFARDVTGLAIAGGTFQASRHAQIQLVGRTKAAITASYAESLPGLGGQKPPALFAGDHAEVSVDGSTIFGIESWNQARIIVRHSATGPTSVVTEGPAIFGRRHDCVPKAFYPVALWGPPNYPYPFGSRPSHTIDIEGDTWRDAAGNQWECTHSGVTWLADTDADYNDRDAYSRWAARSNPIVVRMATWPTNSWDWPLRSFMPQEDFRLERVEAYNSSGPLLPSGPLSATELAGVWIRGGGLGGVAAAENYPAFAPPAGGTKPPGIWTMLIHGRSLE